MYTYVGSTNLGSSYASATITCVVVDSSANPLLTQPTRSVVPLGGGVFGVHIPDMPSGQVGWVVLKEGSATLDALIISPAETEPVTITAGPAPLLSGMHMIPFPAEFYPDDIRVQRVTWIKRSGQNVADYSNPPGPVERASVQSRQVDRADPSTGRITTETIHSVRTPDNRGFKPLDRILWIDKSGLDHTLVVEGPETPKGIGDVQFKVECIEKL